MSELPFVDEHALVIEAPPPAVWSALLAVVPRAFESRTSALGARLLGCEYCASSGQRPLAPGSTFPGFVVALAEPELRLSLEGSHRFSHYRLVYALEDLGAGCTRVRAGTWAAFPGLHVVVLRRTLAAVARRARRAA